MTFSFTSTRMGAKCPFRREIRWVESKLREKVLKQLFTHSDLVLAGKLSKDGKDDILKHCTSIEVHLHSTGHLSPFPNSAKNKTARITVNILH